VQQGEEPQRAVGGDQVEIGHAAAQQRVSFSEVVMNVQTRHHGEVLLAGLVQLHQLAHRFAQGPDTIVTPLDYGERHGVAQQAGTDWVPLRMLGVQEALRRCSMDRLSELPSQIHRVLDTGVESLSAYWGVYVGRVAGQEHAAVAVGGRLPSHIGKPGNMVGVAEAIICPVDGDEGLADIAQGRLVALTDQLFIQHDSRTSAVFELSNSIDTLSTTADAV